MLTGLFVLEDHCLRLHRDDKRWWCEVANAHTGESTEITLNDEEAAALLFLAIAGDTGNPADAEMRALLAPHFEGLPRTLQPFP